MTLATLMVLMSPLCSMPVSASDSVAARWAEGIPFSRFLAAATSRRAAWQGNYAKGIPSPELLVRAKRIRGTWGFLVVAEDWCGDSANTIPYLAALVDSVPGFELRIIDSRAGRDLMEARRTVDGRAATPTVIVLDESLREVGCWVERPAPLQAWFQEHKPRMSSASLNTEKYAWYDRDAGRTTLQELLDVVGRAAAAQLVTSCGGGV